MTRARRILVVSHSPAVWGAELVLLRLAPEFARHGVELTVVCPDPSDHARAWQSQGVPVIDLGLTSGSGLRGDRGERVSPVALVRAGYASTRSAVRLARVIRAQGIDVVHSNSLTAHMEVAVAARLARRGAVVHLHDIVVPGLGRRLLGVVARLGAHVVAISGAVAAGVTGGRVTTVPNGVDEAVFTPGPTDRDVRLALGGDDDVLVGVLGRLDPEKRVEHVVRAVADVATRHRVRLAVVGAPLRASESYVRGLQEEAARLLPGRVAFVAPRSDMPSVMRSLDVVVSAAEAEPFGLTLLEAQACGTPVAAMRSGGIPDFVIDGETGLLADDLDGLATAIGRLAADRELARRLAVTARDRVTEEYTLRRQALRLVEIYDGTSRQFARNAANASGPRA